MLNFADFQGLIVLLLVIFILIALFKKATRFIYFCVAVLCLMQVGYMLSQTSLNEKYNLSTYFKYDIINSVKSIWETTDKEQLVEDAEMTTKSLISKISYFIKEFLGDITGNEESSGDISKNIDELKLIRIINKEIVT